MQLLGYVFLSLAVESIHSMISIDMLMISTYILMFSMYLAALRRAGRSV